MRCLRFVLSIVIVWGLMALSNICLCQSSYLDSLRQVLPQVFSDTQRVNVLCDIAWELRKSGGQSVLSYLQEAKQVAEPIQYLKGMGKVYMQLGAFYQQNGRYDKAEEYYLKALEARKKDGDVMGVCRVHSNLGELKMLQGDYVATEKHFGLALMIAKSQADSMAVAKLHIQHCRLFKAMGDLNQSEDYGFSALRMLDAQAKRDSIVIGKAWMALGGTFESMGVSDRAKGAYERAQRCFLATRQTFELCGVFNNLGNVEEYRANYSGALDYYRQSYSYRMVLYDTINAVKTLRNIAQCYKSLKQFSRAKAELLEAADLLKGTQDLRQSILIQADMAELNIWEGKPQKSIETLDRLLPLLDSLADPAFSIYFRHMLSKAYMAIGDWSSSLDMHLQAMHRRYQMDLKINGSLYQYDRYLFTTLENDRMKAAAEILLRDLEIEKGKRRILLLILVAAGLVLVGSVVVSLQRIRLLQNKRRTAEAELALERKEREVERLEQSKKLEFLQVSLEVEDRERSRIAHDLHDRVGAQMAAVKYLFGQLRDELVVAAPAFALAAEKLNGELQDLMAEVRAVSHDLESPTLKKFGLVAAIRGFKDMFAKAPTLDFELDVHGLEERLAPSMEKHIYLILKELFSNAIRYGNPTMFSIQLMREGNQLTVLVEDNGSGFDPYNLRPDSGMGLQSVSNRVNSMNGKLVIDSAKDRGTIVTIEIPISEKIK
jgi:two-component system, NarL family, sensor kinase